MNSIFSKHSMAPMDLDAFIKIMVPNYTIDPEEGTVVCDFDELKANTKAHIKRVTGRDAHIYFCQHHIEICFGTEEDLYTRPEMVEQIAYEDMF